MKTIKIILLLILVISVLSIPILAAKPTSKTGLDVYIESMGFSLDSYQISDKYNDFDKNKWVILDIVISKDDISYSYTWVMTFEKYLERREKI